jgi:cytochrome c oxidase subunit 2
MFKLKQIGFISAITVTALASLGANAQQPEPWQIGFQPSATGIMEQTTWFHNVMLMPIITATVIIVMALMLWIIIRYNAKANPNPSKVSHNTFIEVVWTAIPVLILIVIAVPSFGILYHQEQIPAEVDITIKATGAQFNWTYEYQDFEGFEVISNMKTDQQLDPGEPRLLAVDYNAKVPAGKTIRIITTASDVIHAFAVPAFGVKKDAVPGRLNETWFTAPEDTGIYYGQCSELCGPGHAFMPIAVEVVAPNEFKTWAEQQMADQGLTTTTQQLAAAN